ncbi:unnamed protein product [Paramecium sonneborni]|uniref:Uncharacterized protein n=1 Tax=Paramecium sonneborni TaxID=65129 RepID=A0A8S1RTT3_9CILI|nr:unnamed protein product [Paramecium sonneborni]
MLRMYDKYFLLENECINKCPLFSNDCLDYVVELIFSVYLVKAFYDNHMTCDNIISHFDEERIFLLERNSHQIKINLYLKLCQYGIMLNTQKYTRLVVHIMLLYCI